MMEIFPTVVPQSVSDIEALVSRCSFTRAFHVDAADGIFAPNKTWMPETGSTLPDAGNVFYEAHLMVQNPEVAGLTFLSAGAKRIIAHAEVFASESDAKRVFGSWRASGAQEIGIALLIDSPLESLDPYMELCDSVTLMTIASVGTQGNPFDERGYGRVADLHSRFPELVIEVDGGIGAVQIPTLARAGASRFSVGSAIARSADPGRTHNELLDLAQKAL